MRTPGSDRKADLRWHRRWPRTTASPIAGDWSRFDRWTPDLSNLDPSGLAIVRSALQLGSQLRQPDQAARQKRLGDIRSVLTRTGTVRLDALVELGFYGLTDEAFELADQASFADMFVRDGVRPSGHYNFGVVFGARPGMAADRRFVALCAKMGLCDYWVATGNWPDVADQVPYDFRAEATQLAQA